MITDQDIKPYPKTSASNHDPVIEAKLNSMLEHYPNRVTYAREFSIFEKGIRQTEKWKFTCYPPESEFIEALVRLTERRKVLELGTYTGFTTLHLMRAVLPLRGTVTTVDVQRVFPEEIFSEFLKSGLCRFVQGHTPEILSRFGGEMFDMVFVDSDHSANHNELERIELWKITNPGAIFVFHDLPRIPYPGAAEETDIRKWINGCVSRGLFTGLILPSCWRMDSAIANGTVNYDRGVDPHLGVFIRQ